MPAAALLVLVCLFGPSVEVPEVVTSPPATPPTAPAAPITEGEPPSPTATGPAGTPTEPGAPALVDPWASVPLQIVVPTRPVPAPAPTVHPGPATHAPLLDPFANARRSGPRKLDPELRDPFHSLRVHSVGGHPGGARLAQADLRDPFARQPPSPAAVTAEPAAHPRAAEPAMPLHPDLRDPFGRRKARPTPPPSHPPPDHPPPDHGAPALPTVQPLAPRAPAPPSAAAPPREATPRSGAFLPSARPFAHLPRTRRPA